MSADNVTNMLISVCMQMSDHHIQKEENGSLHRAAYQTARHPCIYKPTTVIYKCIVNI